MNAGLPRWVRVAALPLLLTAGSADAQPGVTAPPDLSGWWVWVTPQNGAPPFPFLDAPLKGDMAVLVRTMRDGFARAKLPDLADFGVDQRRAFCRPPVFAGASGNVAAAVEFLFTPGRLTILNEEGLVRRVPLDGSTLPATVEESSMGTSVGRWAGRTLIIETIGTKGDGVPVAFGKGARFTERLTLRDTDTLEIAVRIVAPDVLERPYDEVMTYTRDRRHVFHEVTSCVDNDPSLDAQTGRQELDLTPPSDLPPPPAD